ncbi:MAG: mechanosensitive ion channel family protein [Planctomycetes bacterium]|nr:mechanosensitive ion channel family protein [Planctomycetota bacterium]
MLSPIALFVTETIDGFISAALDNRLLQTGLVIAWAYIIAEVSAFAAFRKQEDARRKHAMRKLILYLFGAIGFCLIAYIWIDSAERFSTFLTITGAGLAVALHHVLLGVGGFIAIVMRGLWKVGDRIEIDGVVGDVVDISLNHTTIQECGNWVSRDQPTGRLVTLPNSVVFTGKTFNSSRGFPFIWNEIRIMVTFESDWKLAEKVINEIAHERHDSSVDHANTYIRKLGKECYIAPYSKLTPHTFPEIGDSGVSIVLRYLCEVNKRMISEQEFNRMILDRFDEHPSIEFAYPTVRAYNTDVAHAGSKFRTEINSAVAGAFMAGRVAKGSA